MSLFGGKVKLLICIIFMQNFVMYNSLTNQPTTHALYGQVGHLQGLGSNTLAYIIDNGPECSCHGRCMI